MSYNTPYQVTEADKTTCQNLSHKAASQLLRQLLWHRYQLALYARNLKTQKPFDKKSALSMLDALPQMLEQHGLRDLAGHFAKEIATLRDYLAVRHYRDDMEAGQVIKIGFHIKNTEDQLHGIFGSFGGMSGQTMGETTPDALDARATAAPKFVAASEIKTLEQYVRQMESSAPLRRTEPQRHQAELFSKVQEFLKKLPEDDLADVLFHALDENQPLPPAINQRVRTTLGNQAVRDMIVASINGPTSALEAVPAALASLATSEPMFTVETDQAKVTKRLTQIQEERGAALTPQGPFRRSTSGPGRGGLSGGR